MGGDELRKKSVSLQLISHSVGNQIIIESANAGWVCKEAAE